MNAQYVFRGLVIMTYAPQFKQFRILEEAWQCKFIPEDMDLMCKFMQQAKAHMLGEDVQVESVGVG